MSRRIALACAALLLCAGCGHYVDVKGRLAALDKTQPTATVADLVYEKLGPRADRTFWIDEKSPVVDFGKDGKSYTAAFELPASGDYMLRMRSYSLHAGLLDAAVFFPVVVFLDADKNPLTTSGAWTASRGGLFTDEPNASVLLEYSEWITPERNFRYIVIHTTPDLIARGGRAALPSPVQVAAASYHYVPLFFPTGPAGPIELEGSAVGYLRIKIEPREE
ncbi:MAG TPA: hypothetical protein VN823_11690 [Stellaceae bacterium]|nr:hypothetical protein [Stellaceae bacterium]